MLGVVKYKPFLAAMILDNPANHFSLPQQTAASVEQHFSSWLHKAP